MLEAFDSSVQTERWKKELGRDSRISIDWYAAKLRQHFGEFEYVYKDAAGIGKVFTGLQVKNPNKAYNVIIV